METTEKRLLQIHEVCSTLGISRSAVYRLIGSKVLASVRIGKSVRIPTMEIDRYIESLIQIHDVA